MTGPSLTLEQSSRAADLRVAGLSWATIARALGCSLSCARTAALRVLRARGERLAPSKHTGRPSGSRGCGDAYQESLMRAWRSRGWSWARIARIFRLPESTIRGRCR